MTRSLKITGLFLALVIAYYGTFNHLTSQRAQYLEDNFMDYTLPSALTGPASLEFKGLSSDYLLFKFMAFLGGRVQAISDNDPRYGSYIFSTLDTITDLDPYYWDAYLFAEMFLAWSGHPEKANQILEKAMIHRPDDYRPPYYIGFNNHLFLKDSKTASQYLMKAARLPGCPYYIGALAARLSVFSFQHKDGIVFLEEMLKNTTDKRARREFELRITTMKILDFLEGKITEFNERFGHFPKQLEELVSAGLIRQIPEDPYKGQFVIMGNGRVYTTSKMLAYPAKKKK